MVSHPIRLLIVEDEQLLAQTLASWIRAQSEFELAGCALDGEAGWALYRQALPHLVLLDIQLPKLDGLELSQKILRQKTATRILLMSGMTILIPSGACARAACTVTWTKTRARNGWSRPRAPWPPAGPVRLLSIRTQPLQIEVLLAELVELGRWQQLDGVVQHIKNILVPERANRRTEFVRVDLVGFPVHCYSFSIR